MRDRAPVGGFGKGRGEGGKEDEGTLIVKLMRTRRKGRAVTEGRRVTSDPVVSVDWRCPLNPGILYRGEILTRHLRHYFYYRILFKHMSA